MDRTTPDAGTPYLPALAGIRAVLDATTEPTIVIDEDDRIRVANQAACAFLGYLGTDLVGQTFDMLVPSGRAAQIGQLRRAWAVSPAPGSLGSGLDLRARRADGVEVPVELQITPVTTNEGAVVMVAIHDMSVVHHDTRLFRALLEAAPDAVVIVDEAGTIRLVNEAAEKCFGYVRDELVGRSIELLVPERFAPHHRHLRQAHFAAPHSRPMAQAGALSARRKDGSEFPVEISLAPVVTEDGPLVIADVRDVTERLEAIDAVRRAEEQHRFQVATDRAKDQFLATVSHELRTPLASIMGFAELITDMADLSPELEHFMSILMRNARREARLVDDLLTLVNINEGGMTVRAAPADLTTIVSEAVASAGPQAEEAGVTLELEQPGDELIIVCDADRVGQALDSLLSNALKFTPAGGRVQVRLEVHESMARIEVADSGIGIGDPDPARVFERLYRSPTAIEREIPGAGLGLSIAAAIVAAHHGTIRVLSTDDAGSTFEIQLPLGGEFVERPSAPSR
jgi:PAS domain S-box-containing protein